MARPGFFGLLHGSFKQRGVHVAHLLHFFHLHALFHQQLLGGGDLIGRYILKMPLKLRAHFLHRFAPAEPPDQPLQYLLAIHHQLPHNVVHGRGLSAP